MSRLRKLRRAELDDDQTALWERIAGTRGGLALGDGGDELMGPFNAFVHAPGVAKHLTALGQHLRFGLSFDRRLIEVAVCTVGARWKSEFEFWAHRPMAIEHGVDPAVLEAMRRGETPTFIHDDERIVYDVAVALTTDGAVGDELYRSAEEMLGEAGMVELVALVGYYCLISLMLNLFEVPLPPDEQRIFPR